MFIDLTTATFFGIIAGIVVGLLPGFGATSLLILSFPLITGHSLLFCITFYCVLSSVSQYFGSVTTLSFGVPGESTSLPLLEVRKTLQKLDKIDETHFLCAYGSLVASILSGLIIFLSFNIFSQAIFYLKSYISLLCATLGIVLCVLYSNNKMFISVCFILLGWLISKIGYDVVSNQNFLTFDNVYLYAGIPVLPAIMGIYAIPNIIKIFYELEKLPEVSYTYKKVRNKVYLILKSHCTIVRSTIIGFISGLVPYVGNGISSYIAFLVEKKIKLSDPVMQAVAAESANNAANLSVLVPLIILGVAIVPSEFVLLEIIMSSNKSVSWKSLLEDIYLISICLLLANLLAFVLSWNMLKYINLLITKVRIWFPISVVILITLGVYNVGFNYGQELYYIVVLIVFSIFGLILRNYDLLPFVYAFLLQNNIEQIVYRVYKVYF